MEKCNYKQNRDGIYEQRKAYGEENEKFCEKEGSIYQSSQSKRCIVCKEENTVDTFRGKPICKSCQKNIADNF